MKKISVTDEKIKMDFNVVTAYAKPIPARLMYDLTCGLLGCARAEEDSVTGRSYQWFIANMVECCYGVPKPAQNDNRLLTTDGLEALYRRDLDPADFSVYCISVMTTVNTALQNLETAEERRFAEGLLVAQSSILHGIAEYINEVKPGQKSDA